MRPLKLALIAAALAVLPGAANATPAFDDARDSVVAGNVGSALLVIGIGALGVNDQDEQGYTLLHYAAKSGSLDGVKELLGIGANPTIVAHNGSTPLTLATTDAIRAELTAAIAQRKSASAPAAPQP